MLEYGGGGDSQPSPGGYICPGVRWYTTCPPSSPGTARGGRGGYLAVVKPAAVADRCRVADEGVVLPHCQTACGKEVTPRELESEGSTDPDLLHPPYSTPFLASVELVSLCGRICLVDMVDYTPHTAEGLVPLVVLPLQRKLRDCCKTTLLVVLNA